MKLFGKKDKKSKHTDIEYTPEQLEALADLDVQRKAIEVEAERVRVSGKAAKVKVTESKTRTREAKGGRGMSIVFYSIDTPDGTATVNRTPGCGNCAPGACDGCCAPKKDKKLFRRRKHAV